jgi:hypothetical protein
MKNQIDPAMDAIIKHRCAKYKTREDERKAEGDKRNSKTDMAKVRIWHAIDEHISSRVDQDDRDLGFV